MNRRKAPADDLACSPAARDVREDGGVSDATPTPAPRAGRSPRDIALSLLVLLVPVLLLLGIYRVVFSGDAPIATGDLADTWATARHSAPYPVLEPAGLPANWTAISARYADGNLRIGYVTATGTGIQLVESATPVDQLLPAELGTGARPGDLVTIGDRQWRSYPVARSDNRALVLVDTGRTTIVVGTASDADLRSFAATLR
jgi:Protein of unknown function (DUF4245)